MVMSGLPYSRKLRVFLCHSSNDKPAVRSIYLHLLKDGYEPWLDEESLVAGQEWEREILKAVRSSDIVLVCLSKNSINKAGFVQKEIRFALDIADEQPEGAIYIIPVKLEECDVPERLKHWHWINLFNKSGYERLVLALQKRADSLGITIKSADSKEDGDLELIIQELLETTGRDKIILTGKTYQRELDELKRKAELLAQLFEFNMALSTVFDSEQVFNYVVNVIFRMAPVDRVIALVNDESHKNYIENVATNLRIIAIRARDRILEEDAKHSSSSLLVASEAIRRNLSISSTDASSDEYIGKFYSASSNNRHVYSMMCAPIINVSGTFGALYADRLDPEIPFNDDDIQILAAIGTCTASAIERIQIHERLLRGF